MFATAAVPPPVTADVAQARGSAAFMCGLRPASLSQAQSQSRPITGLPPTRHNVKLVSRLKLRHPDGELRPGEIADVSHYGDYAYLNGWYSSTTGTCERGGVYVVDISNLAHPRQVAFIPSPVGTYPGEGTQVVHLKTRAFEGDVLTINNEYCVTSGTPETRRGGFSLIDVTNPRRPTPLAMSAGDLTPTDAWEEKTHAEHDVHSAFTWQAGDRAYTAATDNINQIGIDVTEPDIDIFDVTNPRAPQLVSETLLTGLWNMSGGGMLPRAFLHDVVVKPIRGRQIMLASYWDLGYVQLDVTNPAQPVVLSHSNFASPDPLFGDFATAGGNAHEAEFSFDNRFTVAADENFEPFSLRTVQITSGAHAGDYAGSAVLGAGRPNNAPDRRINGPTVYGGYGCSGSAPLPKRSDVTLPALASGEEAIIVLQRGPADDPSAPEASCLPGEKADNARAAGWDAVLLTNRHLGSAAADDAYCGAGGYLLEAPMLSVCTTHAALHRLFGSEPNHDLPVPPADAPALGTVGERVSVIDEFSGWGYTHLFDRATMQELDVWAPAESRDVRYAEGFGDLTVHEVANDPVTNLAYVSHYNAGFRVLSFNNGKLKEVGRFIDERGNNLWGVDVAEKRNGARVILASDRDYGLYVLRYTGPGAVGPDDE